MNENIETAVNFWNWYRLLPGIAKTILSLLFMITVPALFITWFTLTHPTSPDASKLEAILSKVDGLTSQIDAENVLNKRFRDRQGVVNDSIIRQLNGMEATIADISIILAANSNSDMLRQLLPYLNNIDKHIDKTYNLLINVQKKQALDSLKFGIGVRKKYPLKN